MRTFTPAAPLASETDVQGATRDPMVRFRAVERVYRLGREGDGQA
jgi:hypothetical protein